MSSIGDPVVRPMMAFAGVCQVGDDVVVTVSQIRFSGEDAERLRRFIGGRGVLVEVSVLTARDDEVLR